MSDSLSFLLHGGGRARALVLAAASLVLPGALLLFLHDRALVVALGVTGTALMSASITFPLLICAFVGVATIQLSIPARKSSAAESEESFWDLLFGAAIVVTLAMYALCLVAYFRRPLSVGRSVIMTAVVLFVLAAIVFLYRNSRLLRPERRVAKHHSSEEA